MRRLIAIVTLLAIVALAVAMFARGIGISARRRPTAIETRLARTAWRFLVPREYRDRANPVPASADVIHEAMEHWADHCATCHANDGSGDTQIGRNLHPPAPDMRAARTQQLTDGELFYAIEQGVPFAGMPAWSTGTDGGARASWALVRFIRHLPSITPEELKRMEALNPRSPAEERHKHEIDEFLRGTGK